MRVLDERNRCRGMHLLGLLLEGLVKKNACFHLPEKTENLTGFKVLVQVILFVFFYLLVTDLNTVNPLSHEY